LNLVIFLDQRLGDACLEWHWFQCRKTQQHASRCMIECHFLPIRQADPGTKINPLKKKEFDYLFRQMGHAIPFSAAANHILRWHYRAIATPVLACRSIGHGGAGIGSAVPASQATRGWEPVRADDRSARALPLDNLRIAKRF
jgi:hypothetical protein